MLPFAIENLSLRADAGPKHRQLYEAMRDAILDGSLAPETRLPATRMLARHLAVSRNTVVAAFEQLRAEGYVVAKVGHGTRVASIAPENLIACAPAPSSGSPKKNGELAPVSPSRPPGPFEPGRPDLTAFPHGLWARLLARSARHAAHLSSPYDEPMGDPALRAAIARHVREFRAVRCTAEQVLVTTSAQAGLMFIARWFLEPGDTVWLENPGYTGARDAFRDARAEIVPVPVDAAGMNPDAAPRGPAPKLIYATPSHQFPLGATMPLSRRLALLERAARAGACIVEDDYDSEFRFSGRPVAALQGLDQGGRVIYMGTFSKTLSPGLRVGYLVLPEHLEMQARRRAFHLSALQPPAVVQAALAQFIEQGQYAAHIRRMRTIYARRLAALQKAAQELPGGARLARCSTGLQVPLFLPQSIDDRRIAARGRGAGLSLFPLSHFCIESRARNGLLLGFAAIPEQEMRVHMGTLAQVLHAARRPLAPAARVHKVSLRHQGRAPQ